MAVLVHSVSGIALKTVRARTEDLWSWRNSAGLVDSSPEAEDRWCLAQSDKAQALGKKGNRER